MTCQAFFIFYDISNCDLCSSRSRRNFKYFSPYSYQSHLVVILTPLTFCSQLYLSNSSLQSIYSRFSMYFRQPLVFRAYFLKKLFHFQCFGPVFEKFSSGLKICNALLFYNFQSGFNVIFPFSHKVGVRAEKMNKFSKRFGPIFIFA